MLNRFSYDADGQLQGTKDVAGSGICLTYDLAGRRIFAGTSGGSSQSYRYDAMGNIVGLTDGLAHHTEFILNQWGRVTGIKKPDGSTEQYTYDHMGNLLRTEDEEGNAVTFRYDRNSNMTARIDQSGSKELFSYYRENRLVSMTDRNGTQTRISYNMYGSITERYQYDARNRLISQDIISLRADVAKVSEHKEYIYDQQGNMVSDGMKNFIYDAMNRLSQVTNSEGHMQVNHYDGEGLRAEMEENGRLVSFLFDGDKVAAETECDGNVIRYIRGYELISSDSEKAKTYYHYTSDEMGSITHVTDEAGNVCNHYEYDAFGEFTVREESISNRFGYAGEQYDSIADLYYLRARFYNPVIGRFIQEDTYYGDGLNLYSYCQNNPVGYVDPSGHDMCPKKEAAINKLMEDNGLTKEQAETYYNLLKNDKIKQAENAQKTAGDLSDKYGYGNKPKKTVASDGITNTLSGWKALDENSEFTRVSVDEVINKSNEIGHKLRNAGANDQGVSGRYNASHAEKQLSIISDKPIGISQPMCTDCQGYFKNLAINEGKVYITADPKTIRIFNPDGTVIEVIR